MAPALILISGGDFNPAEVQRRFEDGRIDAFRKAEALGKPSAPRLGLEVPYGASTGRKFNGEYGCCRPTELLLSPAVLRLAARRSKAGNQHGPAASVFCVASGRVLSKRAFNSRTAPEDL